MALPTRRRFLEILAATSAAAICPIGPGRAAEPLHRWEGSALGADTTIALAGVSEHDAAGLFQLCLKETKRLEGVLSLYRSDSQISLLNRTGSLERPDRDLLALLELSRQINLVSGGAFDPSIQPLWLLFAETFGSLSNPRAPTATEIAARRAKVNFRDVAWSEERVTFAQGGMALTLNGIAQGLITDRVTELLRTHGLRHALVSLGEHRAIGAHPEMRPWQIGIQDPRRADAIVETMELVSQAIATSGGYGSRLGNSGVSHLIDARTGESATKYLSVSVRHASAAVADGLSTAFSFLSEGEIRAAKTRFGEMAVVLVKENGSVARI
jgi:thiamine biosynthesis lipoprotein